ncbi:MAG: DUF4836 family protein [Prevotellaceae bacterium]|jgi:hypothetical protein|nr:DUF4836 family protein [Prevotellaceae bacterium]
MRIFKFILLSFSLFLAGTLFSSCGEKSSEKSSDILSLIPADATLVVEVNGKDIFSKSGLNKPEDYKFMSFLKMMSADAYSFIENLLKDSKDAGISISKTVVYASLSKEKYGIIARMSDRRVWENVLSKMDAGVEIDTEGDISFISESGSGITLAWNNEYIAALVLKRGERDELKELLTPKKDGLYANNDDFQNFTKHVGDLKFWMKYSDLMNFMKKFPGGDMVDETLLEQMENINYNCYISFNDGRIDVSGGTSPADEAEKMVKKLNFTKEKFNTELFKDIPEQSYLEFHLAFKLREFVEYIEKFMLSKSSLDRDEFQNIIDSPTARTVFDAVDGDVLFSIHGFGSFGIPYASIVFSVKNEDAFNSILALLPKDMYKKLNGYFEFSFGQMVPVSVYFAYKNNSVIVTDELASIEKFIGKTQSKSFADNPVSKILAGASSFYLNLDYESYPAHIATILRSAMESSVYKYFETHIALYECIYGISTSLTTVEGAVVFKNKNVNSLKQILTNIDKMINFLN